MAAIIVDQSFTWDIENILNVDFGFNWDIGIGTRYYYRIEGKCINPSCTVGFKNIDAKCGSGGNDGQKILLTIDGTDLADVCTKLKETFLNYPLSWPILSIRRFSLPVYVDDTIDNSCNTLIEEDFTNIPECFDLALNTVGIVEMGLRSFVQQDFLSAVGNGGIRIVSGGPVLARKYTGSGVLLLSGGIDTSSSLWIYSASGVLEIPEEYAGVVSPVWVYVGSGEITLGGEQTVISSAYEILATGEVLTSGSAIVQYVLPRVASGEITLFGEANCIEGAVAFTARPCSGMSFDESFSNSFAIEILGCLNIDDHIISGGIFTSGEAGIVSSAWHTSGDGEIITDGDAVAAKSWWSFIVDPESLDTRPTINFILSDSPFDGLYSIGIDSPAITYDKDFGDWNITINLDGSAHIVDSNTGDFGDWAAGSITNDIWYPGSYFGIGTLVGISVVSVPGTKSGQYRLNLPFSGSGEISVQGGMLIHYTGSGEMTLDGTVDIVSPVWNYTASGEIVASSEALVRSSWLGEFTASMGIGTTLPFFEAAFYDIPVEETLAADTSLVRTTCNCGELPLILQLKHNMINSNNLYNFLIRNNLSFPSLITLRYNGNDGMWRSCYNLIGIGETNAVERWNFVFEWGCVEEEVSNWKFSVLASNRNMSTGEDEYTRLLYTFSPEGVCDNNKLNFTFKIDTMDGTVVQSNANVESEIYSDEMNLFGSSFWAKNPILIFTISQFTPVSDSQYFDISSIFPKPLLVTR